MNPIGIRSCYDEGKRCAETLFFDYRRQHGMDAKVVRLFNTYGPRMALDDGRVVSNFIVQALRGEEITIFGSGEQTRSFCYVDDTVEVLLRMMATPAEVSGPVNVGNPGEFTMLELAREVLTLTGSDSNIAFRPLPSDDPRRRKPDITRANELLGWQPTTALSDGLRPTIDYFRNEPRRRLTHLSPGRGVDNRGSPSQDRCSNPGRGGRECSDPDWIGRDHQCQTQAEAWRRPNSTRLPTTYREPSARPEPGRSPGAPMSRPPEARRPGGGWWRCPHLGRG